MTILLGSLWPGLAASAVLGLLTGWLAGRPARPLVPLSLCAVAALVAALAWAGPVPGLPGLWPESAALILPPYLAGCGLGAWARFFWGSRRGRRPEASPPLAKASDDGPRPASKRVKGLSS